MNRTVSGSRPWRHVWRGSRYSRPALRERRAGERLSTLRRLGFSVTPQDRLLDAGCGDGAFLRMVAPEIDSATGIAIGIDMELALRATNPIGPSPKTCRADANSLPFATGSFTIVTAFGLLEHIRDPAASVKELRRVARDDAYAYVTFSNTRSMVFIVRLLREFIRLWPYGYQHNYSMRAARQLFAAEFGVVNITVQQTDWDFPVSALTDRLIHCLVQSWGRYIVVRGIALPQTTLTAASTGAP